MRINLSIFFAMLMVFVLFTPYSYEKTSASTNSSIVLTSDVLGRFQLHNGEKVKYITLLKGQYYNATSANEKEWSIQVGSGTITIPKLLTKTSTKKIADHITTNKANIITLKNANVYTEPSKNGKMMARFVENVRISTNGLTGNYYEVIVGGQRGFVNKNDIAVDNGIPILLYHHFVQNQKNSVFKDNLSVFDIDLFKEQMNYLVNNDFTTISLEDFELWKEKKQALPGKVVVLTFDDANLSLEKLVYPIVKQHNMKATTFVIGNRVKEEVPEFDMNKVQFAGFQELSAIRDVFDLEYHTYGYHSYNSVFGRSTFQEASAHAIQQDIENFKQVVQTIEPTIEPKYFAYPYGLYNKAHETTLLKNGITLAFKNKGGKATMYNHNLYLPRIPIQATTTLEQFITAVEN